MFNKKSTKKSLSKGKKIALIIGLILIFAVASGSFYTYLQLNKVKSTKISKSDYDLGITPEAKEKIKQEDTDNSIVNIALFGLDRRTKNEPSRSDSTIIVSIDKKHNKIKLSSLMRDSYVNVSGHGMTKLTHAYAYAGPQLAINTINSNFDMDIKDYVAVDFFQLEKIIDAVGGVDINVSADEVPLINQTAQEVVNIEKTQYQPITKPGLQRLNGTQAVAYSRTRHLEGGDFKRTERQRIVLTALLTKIQQSGASNYPKLVSSLLPYVETSMSKIDILKLGTSIFTNNINILEQERFPIDGYCNAKTISGIWYLWLDIPATKDQLHKYIYDDVKPTPKAPLF